MEMPLGKLFTQRQETGEASLPLLSLTYKEGIIPQEQSNRKDNSNQDKSKYLKVVIGDVAYNTMRMWEGRSAYVGLEGLVSPAYTVCKPGLETDGLFFSHYFKTAGMIAQFRRYSQGLVKDTLSLKYEAFARIVSASPQLAEQQKIAKCLFSIDELITAMTRNLETLRAHKKGLMQRLFPRPGETQPRLRFPEFRNEPGWVLRRADLIFANRSECGEEGLPIYSVTMNDGMVKRSFLDRKIDDISDSASNKKACKNDIAYNMMRMWQGAFGVAKEDCMVSPAYVVLMPQEGVLSDFFAQFLKLPDYLRLLTSHSRGLTKDRLRLYYKDFEKISLPYTTLPEQQKIVNCLRSLDGLIAVEGQKLETLRAHKQGLMQQLFPSPEETEA